MEWFSYVGDFSGLVEAGAAGAMGVEEGMAMEVEDWITEAQEFSAGIGKWLAETASAVGGGEGRVTREGIESVGRGKKRTMPRESWGGVMDLPNDLGVEM